MSAEYTDAAYHAYIESLTIRAAEMAWEQGNDEGITQKALLASIGNTFLEAARQHFVAAALLSDQDDQVVTLGPDHPYRTGREV